MSDFYDDDVVNKLEGEELDRFYEGKDINKRFLIYMVIYPLIVLSLICSVIFYFNKTADRDILVREVKNVTNLYESLNDIIKDESVDDLKRHLQFMKKSDSESYNSMFSNLKITNDGFENYWGGAVIPNGKYPDELMITYYNVPNGNKCIYFIGKQRSSGWNTVVFGDYITSEKNKLSNLKTKDITKLCRSSSVVTFEK